MNKKNLIILVTISLLVGSGSFYAGMKYQQSQRTRPQNLTNRSGNNFRPVMGEILNSDDKSLIMKLPDGSSKIILLSAKTEIDKSSTASASDLKTGIKVTVTGQTNNDGSITADRLLLR